MLIQEAGNSADGMEERESEVKRPSATSYIDPPTASTGSVRASQRWESGRLGE